MEGRSIRERLQELERREQVGLAIIAVLILAGAAFWYVRSLPSRVQIEATGGTGTSAGRAVVGSGPDSAGPADPGGVDRPTPSPTPIVVDVAGWVRHPGVYEFSPGDRVIDAIRRAGGSRPGADLTSINLAAVLTDAEQIVVGRSSGGGIVSRVGAGDTTGSTDASGGAGGTTGGTINLNTATLDELETLPGIGPTLGQRILDYRQAHGPFHSVDDLLNVSGIGDKRLADLRQKVTV